MSPATNAATVTVSCPSGKIAVGGGGSSTTEELRVSIPIGTSPPTGWSVTFNSAHSSHKAYVICAS